MSKLRLSILALFIVSALAGCAKNEDSKSNPAKTAPGPVTKKEEELIEVPNNASFEEAVEYLTACENDPKSKLADIPTPSSRFKYSETENRFTRTLLVSTVAGSCDGEEAALITEVGTVTSKNGTHPHEADLIIGQTTVTLQKKLLKLAFNSAKMCGFSDWEIGVEKDITANEECIGRKNSPRAEHISIDLVSETARQ